MLQLILAVTCILLLLLYGAAAWRASGRDRAWALLPAAAVTGCLVLLETLLVEFPELLPRAMKPLLLCQYLLGPSWLLFSLAYGRKFSWNALSRLNQFMLLLALFPLPFLPIPPVSTFFYQTDFALEPLFFLEPVTFFFYLHLVLVLLLTLGNLESTLRGTHHSDHWRIKLAVLGAGALIASLALFYSQGILFKALNMRYLPLRTLGMILGLVLLHFAEWQRGSGKIVLARRIAFRSVAVTFAGLYLLSLGLVREGARFFGEDFSRTLLIVLVALSVLACLLFALSQTARRKLGIWVQKNLYNEKYDYRGQWLQFSERLSQATDKESLIRASLLCFCETFGFVGGVFWPVEKDASSSLGRGVYYEVNEPEDALAAPADLAPLLAMPGMPVAVRALEGKLPPKALAHLQEIRTEIVLPVHTADGPEGILVLGAPIDGSEKHDIEDFELMEAMGRQIGLCVKSFRLGDELVTAREMEALGRLGTFVLHDLKNQVYALSLLTENARRFIGDPEFQQDMLETLGNTVANMKILITQLGQLPKSANLRLEQVDLKRLAARTRAQVPRANIRITGDHVAVQGDAEQLGKVLTNLCLNAYEAGGDKPIHIEIADEDGPLLRVHDQSGGIAEEVMRHGLFKPFNSTKQRGMGIGLYHSRKIIEAHGGVIQVENRPGKGSTFIVRFAPKTSSAAAHVPPAAHESPPLSGAIQESL